MKEGLYKTTITFEVLSDRKLTDMRGYDLSLLEIASECTYGEFSGMELDRKEEILSRTKMAEALLNQGSDPEFLLIND